MEMFTKFFFFLSLEDWFQFVAEKHNFAIVVEVDLFFYFIYLGVELCETFPSHLIDKIN